MRLLNGIILNNIAKKNIALQYCDIVLNKPI